MNETAAAHASAVLVAENISKRFGDVKALSDFSVRIDRGEIFGLIGPDGAGKTTAMRIVCGLQLADSGFTRVAGYDPAQEPQRVKEHIGYMPQRFSLYPDLTVAENLRFFADLYGVPPHERESREAKLMQFSRLDPFRNRRAGKLSGGMKQKLALSCTLIHTPDLLILDEPTTGVDPISRQEFWSILRSLAAEGRGLLVSTPYMDESLLCNRVALMHRGRIIAEGTPHEITQRFDRKLLEISGAAVNTARHTLKLNPVAGVSVARFGDKLHAVHDREDQLAAVRARLSGLEVELKPATPSIEDTFVLLMEQPREP